MLEQHIQLYTKYINNDLAHLDIDSATYKEHLHKSFEWFACIKLSQQYNSIFYCWHDVPPNIREEKKMIRDMGIDAWDIDGNRIAQMKLYNGSINWQTLSTFLACSLRFKDVERILYRTKESQLVAINQSLVDDKLLVDITIPGMEFRSECKSIQSLIFQPKELIEEVALRPYQIEAEKYIKQGKDEIKNVSLCLPTGTGKTTVMIEYHCKNRTEITLVLVPRVVLMEQWGEECEKRGFKPFLIGTGQESNLDKYNNESIVICVYDSFPNIYDQKDMFDRFCVDEAHHIKTPERYMEYECSDDGNVYEDFIVSYMESIQSLSVTNSVIYLSATLDKPNDDSLFYEYKVRQAINDGYLCDYQFIFPIFETEHTTNDFLATYLVHTQHESHCIVYAPSCKAGKEFTDLLNQLKPGCAGYIDATTTSKERKQILKKLEIGDLDFIVNIRILVEGYNAPHIRSIFFLHISDAIIFTIQAIGRALRIHNEKIIATIYVPFTHENDIDRIHSFINQLASYDERIKESIVGKKIGGYLNVSNECNNVNNECDDLHFNHMYNMIIKSMDENDSFEKLWMKHFNEYTLQETFKSKQWKKKQRRNLFWKLGIVWNIVTCRNLFENTDVIGLFFDSVKNHWCSTTNWIGIKFSYEEKTDTEKIITFLNVNKASILQIVYGKNNHYKREFVLYCFDKNEIVDVGEFEKNHVKNKSDVQYVFFVSNVWIVKPKWLGIQFSYKEKEDAENFMTFLNENKECIFKNVNGKDNDYKRKYVLECFDKNEIVDIVEFETNYVQAKKSDVQYVNFVSNVWIVKPKWLGIQFSYKEQKDAENFMTFLNENKECIFKNVNGKDNDFKRKYVLECFDKNEIVDIVEFETNYVQAKKSDVQYVFFEQKKERWIVKPKWLGLQFTYENKIDAENLMTFLDNNKESILDDVNGLTNDFKRTYILECFDKK